MVGTRGFALKARHRGSVYVPRKAARMTLVRASKKSPDPTLLLPPYVAASELRVLFRLDYDGAFRSLGVRRVQSKYMWADHDGREFETASKRQVLVPFELAVPAAQGLGFRPRLVDVEPDWPGGAGAGAGGPAAAPWGAAAPLPVVAVLGHVSHGKTTLLDALCGTSFAGEEPGGITQGVRATTAPAVCEGPGTAGGAPRRDARLTFLDTPGHAAFEVQRGRTMAAADVALVLVSLERGAEVQTEEVLLHAARWGVPVVFALSKADLPGCHVELTRAELRRQCQRLHERGLVSADWTREAEEAAPISALRGLGLAALVGRLRRALAARPARALPPPPSATPGEALRWREVPRRTDFLVGAEGRPAAVGLVVEVERGGEWAETALTVLVRAGRLAVGQYFVVGTAFGRIAQLSAASGPSGGSPCEAAPAGAAVHLTGLRTKKIGGDCAPDDLLLVLPRERAWRLGEYRRRIEALSALQTSGPPIDVPWEHSALDFASRTQAAFEREQHMQPERHAASAYERRWSSPAIAEFTSDGDAPRTFSTASRREFVAPPEDPQCSAEAGDAGDPAHSEVPAGGRKHARPSARSPGEAPGAAPRRDRRFVPLAPQEEPTSPAHDDAETRGGERPGARAPLATGAWTASVPPRQDFVYYADRRTWTEEAEIDTSRLQSRWRWRDEARWAEAARREDLRAAERGLTEAVRREVFGQPGPPEPGAGTGAEEDGAVARAAEAPGEPLPRRNVPVVPLILKTRSISQFDLLMDEVERLEANYGVRIVIVHGGLGPVAPRDVLHAEVEKRHGFCPVYTFQVGATPEAAGQAAAEHIDLRHFDVFTDLVADVAERCRRLLGKAALRARTEALGGHPSSSGP